MASLVYINTSNNIRYNEKKQFIYRVWLNQKKQLQESIGKLTIQF